MIKILLLCGSILLVYLGYGKRGFEFVRETSGIRKLLIPAIVIALGTGFWGMSLLFWIEGNAQKDLLSCQIATFAYPLLYALWAVFTRKRVNAEIAASEQEEAVIQQEQERYAKREEEARIKWEQSKQAERENPPERIRVAVDRSEETLICPNCKRAQRSNREFCYNCGAIFEDPYAKREEETCTECEQSKQTGRVDPSGKIHIAVDRSEETLICPNCKRAQRSNREFCYNCGAIFEDQ